MIEPALSTATPAPEEDVTTTLYRAAIGPLSNGYYLPIFTRFEAADHAGISWNTAAALSTLNWLAFRQLWGAALAYFGALVAVVLLVFGIGRLVFQLPDTLVGALALGFGLAAFVLPGLFGNAVFHTECRKRMSRALVAHSDVAEARAQLTRQASTRKRAIILAVVNIVLLAVAVLAYLQLSALSNLTVMPAGALEDGHVAVGRAVDAAPSASATPAAQPASASSSIATPPVAAPSAPATPASEAASNPATSASMPDVSLAAPVPSLAPAVAPASVPVPASAPALATSNTMAMVDAVRRDGSNPLAASKPLAKSKQVDADKPPKTQVKSQPSTAGKAAKPAQPVKTTKPYFVNVGLFKVAANAERAHAKLLAAKLPSQLKELTSAQGPQIRVRAGPFATRQEARDAMETIKSLQLDAILVQP
jgi:hypothetical protein